MDRIKVSSSAIAAYAYDSTEQLLEVVYSPNRKTQMCGVYRYQPVTQEQIDTWLHSDSLGVAFQVIRNCPGINAYKAGDEPAEAQAVSA